MKMAVVRSSATDDWATPAYLFEALNAEFDFQLDVCASFDNRKVNNYFTQQDDALKQSWGGEGVG